MSFGKRLMAILLMTLMCLLPAMDALAVADLSQHGTFATESNGNVYIVLPATSGDSLYSVPSTGGDLTHIETCAIIDDLVPVGDRLFYLRYNAPSYQIVRRDAEGSSIILAEFTPAAGETVERLSYYDEVLYCLVGGILTIVDPDSGENEPLIDTIQMTDYAIAANVIYYISATDTVTYTKANPSGGTDLEKSAGKLYSMSITGMNEEVLLDVGIEDLKAAGGYLFFHNFENSYIMGSTEEMWMEGKLYRYEISGGAVADMNVNYDWDYYATPTGLVVYTSQDLSIYPLTGGDPVSLMQPELYTTLCVYGSDAFVYEHTSQALTRVPINGLQATQIVGGGVVATDDKVTDITDVDETDDTTDETDAETETPTSTGSGTSSGYIFPSSSSKKLTRKQVLAIDKSMWGYARNEIYARHGYVFKKSKYANYFANKTWYAKGGFSSSDLNSIEWYNMELIKELEIEYGLISGSSSTSTSTSGSGSSSGTDGSYIFKNSSRKKLTKKQILALDRSMWGYARNEIYARHGYVFKTSKYAKYFAKKSWYHPGGFSTGDLNSIEWYNMKLIKKLEDQY